MRFQKRAVDSCLRSLNKGMIDEARIRSVLKCERPNVECFVGFLNHSSPDIRFAAFRIVTMKGSIKDVADAFLSESDISNIFRMIEVLGDSGKGLDLIDGALESDNTVIRDCLISMFKRSGNEGSLFPLLFSDDDGVAKRIKRYINEAEKNEKA